MGRRFCRRGRPEPLEAGGLPGWEVISITGPIGVVVPLDLPGNLSDEIPESGDDLGESLSTPGDQELERSVGVESTAGGVVGWLV